MNVGYARVSTSSQNLENQINQLKSSGCEKIFSEKRSGKNESNREQFKIMMDFVREGDVLYITKLDRLARSVIDLHNTAKVLQEKDVHWRGNLNSDTFISTLYAAVTDCNISIFSSNSTGDKPFKKPFHPICNI